MNTLTFDFECTTSNKGNPFDQTNRAVCVGYKHNSYKTNVVFVPKIWQDEISEFAKSVDLFVGFNIKFDLHWLRRYGVVYQGRVWDCQVAEFILQNQTTPYPSLDGVAERYGLSSKDTTVKEYWDKGIDTPDIPGNILSEYCKKDVDLTYEIYLRQRELFATTQKHKYNLFRLTMADLIVLQEMEWNGLKWDSTKAKELSENATTELEELRKDILGVYSNLPININSGDHLSAFLYGGTIVEKYRVPVGVYKTGEKAGQPRYKIMENVYEFPRQFEPTLNSELKKDGYWSTDEATLKSIKADKTQRVVLDKLDEYAKKDKLKGTYYEGITNLIKEMNWPEKTLHGSLNQVVVVTGRLSSSKPNLQNFAEDAKKLIYTRY